MNKHQFLSALEGALTDLSRQDKQRTLDFYREMIDDRLEEGLVEEEAVASIGTPEAIAAQVLSELPQKPGSHWAGKVWVAVLLILGSPIWLPVLISVFAILASVLICVFAAELTLAITGVGCILGGLVMLLFIAPWKAIFFLGVGLLSAGLAIPFFFLCVLIAKGIWKLTKWTFSVLFRKE